MQTIMVVRKLCLQIFIVSFISCSSNDSFLTKTHIYNLDEPIEDVLMEDNQNKVEYVSLATLIVEGNINGTFEINYCHSKDFKNCRKKIINSKGLFKDSILYKNDWYQPNIAIRYVPIKLDSQERLTFNYNFY